MTEHDLIRVLREAAADHLADSKALSYGHMPQFQAFSRWIAQAFNGLASRIEAVAKENSDAKF